MSITKKKGRPRLNESRPPMRTITFKADDETVDDLRALMAEIETPDAQSVAIRKAIRDARARMS